MLRMPGQARPEDLPCLHDPVDAEYAHPLHRLGQELSLQVRLFCLSFPCLDGALNVDGSLAFLANCLAKTMSLRTAPSSKRQRLLGRMVGLLFPFPYEWHRGEAEHLFHVDRVPFSCRDREPQKGSFRFPSRSGIDERGWRASASLREGSSLPSLAPFSPSFSWCPLSIRL
jgi:hypothetical protein